MKPFVLIYVIAFFNFFISAVLLITKRKNEVHASIISSICFIALAYFMLISLLIEWNYINTSSSLKYTFVLEILLLVPLFYHYINLKKRYKERITKTDLIHYIPFGVCLVSYILFFNFFNKNTGLYIQQFNIAMYIVYAACLVYMFCYTEKLRKYSYKYTKYFFDNVSNIDKINLDWTSRGIKAICILIFLNIVLAIIFILNKISFFYFNKAIDIITIIICHYIGYNAIININSINILTEMKIEKKYIKYKKSSLSMQKALNYKKTLLDYMEKHKPFLQDQLSLKELADLVGIHSYHLSQLLNQHFNQTFFEFINDYRIKEAKNMLSDKKHSHLTIVEIMLMVGFSTKSTFNSLFKNKTQLPPSKYREKFSA